MGKVSGTLSANGDSQSIDSLLNPKLTVVLNGDFDSGRITIQYRRKDDVTWQDVQWADFLDNAHKVLDVAANTKYRVTLVGATTPSVYYELANHA